MEKFIDKLVRDFDESVINEESREELTNEYRKNLEKIEKNLRNINYEDEKIENIMMGISKEWINLPVEEKKSRLLHDESFYKIILISNEAFNKAKSILLSSAIEKDFDSSKKIHELEEALKNVKSYNKQKAIKLVSEGELDLRFIENPKTEIVSLRLGYIKNARREREEL